MPPSFLSAILDFRLGDAETGKGFHISDAAVVRLAESCPNLVHVQLDGGTYLTDAALLALFQHCPHLRYVQLSGNDKCTGGLKGSALDALREDPKMAKNLVKLRLTDQNDLQFQKPLKELSTKRKKLSIVVGCTHERGGCCSTWLGGKQRYGYQAFGGPGGFDQFGGFGPY
ncbi:hypothetical protein ZTR_04728 [Talaromyces verruculosus]|nr:hypothetical protein ZTR_04728 [Talaromyces verruculosus]